MSQPQDELQDSAPAYRISHYLATLIDVWRLRNGARFMLRPVLPQDAGLLGDMIRRLSLATRHNRFHSAMSGLSADALRRMTQVDYQRHLGCVITALMQHCRVCYTLNRVEARVVHVEMRLCGAGRRATKALPPTIISMLGAAQ